MATDTAGAASSGEAPETEQRAVFLAAEAVARTAAEAAAKSVAEAFTAAAAAASSSKSAPPDPFQAMMQALVAGLKAPMALLQAFPAEARARNLMLKAGVIKLQEGATGKGASGEKKDDDVE